MIYWEKFHGEFSIPYVAHDLSNKKEVSLRPYSNPINSPTHLPPRPSYHPFIRPLLSAPPALYSTSTAHTLLTSLSHHLSLATPLPPQVMRIARERVMTVVRAYNDIVRDLGTDERHLFIDHLRRLDRRIAPGMIKLTWTSKNVVEMFVKDCCTSCQEMHAVVREFKEAKQVVTKISKQISASSLLRIDKSVIYEGAYPP